MNLFEDWDATERRNQQQKQKKQQQQQQKQSAYRQGSATLRTQQQVSPDPRNLTGSATQYQRKASATSGRAEGVDGSMRSLAWGRQAPPADQTQQVYAEVSAGTGIGGGTGGSSSARLHAATANPFSSVNPFAPSTGNVTAGSNLFASSNSNPYATSNLIGSAGTVPVGTGSGGPRSGRSGFGDASSVSRTAFWAPSEASLELSCVRLNYLPFDDMNNMYP